MPQGDSAAFRNRRNSAIEVTDFPGLSLEKISKPRRISMLTASTGPLLVAWHGDFSTALFRPLLAAVERTRGHC